MSPIPFGPGNDESEFDDDFDELDFEKVLNSWDGPAYPSNTNSDLLIEQFAEACDALGATSSAVAEDGARRAALMHFATRFQSLMVESKTRYGRDHNLPEAVDEDNGEGKDPNPAFLPPTSYVVKDTLPGVALSSLRVNEEQGKMYGLVFQSGAGDDVFFLPVAALQLVDNTGERWGQVMMKPIERLEVRQQVGAAGLIAELDIQDPFSTPIDVMPIFLGASYHISLQHVLRIGVNVAEELRDKRSACVLELEPSAIVAHALTKVNGVEEIMLGVTGVGLSHDSNSLRIGIMSCTQDRFAADDRDCVETAGFPGIITPATHGSLVKERTYQFKLTQPAPGIICPRIDAIIDRPYLEN